MGDPILIKGAKFIVEHRGGSYKRPWIVTMILPNGMRSTMSLHSSESLATKRANRLIEINAAGKWL